MSDMRPLYDVLMMIMTVVTAILIYRIFRAWEKLKRANDLREQQLGESAKIKRKEMDSSFYEPQGEPEFVSRSIIDGVGYSYYRIKSKLKDDK